MKALTLVNHWICVSLGFFLFLIDPVYADDHGNSFSTATQVTIGSITQGSIETPGDLDYFKFTISQPGTYVFFTRGTTDTFGRLYDSTYSLLTDDYDSGEADNFRIVYKFIYTGTYYIEVEHHNEYSGIGSYTLHIEGPGAGTVSDDHGFSPWSASAVNIGSITSGSINLPGDLDYFKFTISQPGTYVFFTRGTTDTFGRLYDSTYSLLTDDYDSGEADNFRIVYKFIYTGTYYIEVEHHNEYSGIGSYTLHIEGPGAGTVSDDHGFSPWSATIINNAGSYPGVINLPGDLDYFRIYVPQSTSITCYTTVNTQSVDTTGKLFDANYNLITSDYNSGEYNNFRIQRQLSPGVYFIEVSHADAYSGIGDYILHIEGSISPQSCPGCSGDPVVLRDATFASGTDCECTAATSITIGPNVTIKNGARVIFKSPRIDVTPGVKIEPGAVVNMRQE